jgi:hypothetical protein
MAVRLRPVLLVAAVALGLLVAFPHLTATPRAPSIQTAAGAVQLPGKDLGSCAPGTERCDPSTPASPLISSLWTGMAFVVALVATGAVSRRPRRSLPKRRLAAGVESGLERPPQLPALAG